MMHLNAGLVALSNVELVALLGHVQKQFKRIQSRIRKHSFSATTLNSTVMVISLQKWVKNDWKGQMSLKVACVCYLMSWLVFQAVQYFKEEMDLPQQKQKLPQILNLFYLKREALALNRLVLYQSQPQNQARVRHYDIESQAIEMLVGFFKKKYQSVLIKTFHSIRTICSLPQKREDVMSERKKRNVTTRRTNLTTTPASELNFKRTGGGKQTRLRRQRNDQNVFNQSSQHSTLRGIINKIKNANAANSLFLATRMQTDHGPDRQNSSFFFANSSRHHPRRFPYSHDVQDDQRMLKFKNSPILHRHSRREYILSKIHRIQDSLSELCNEDDTKQEEANFQILNSINTLRRELQARRQ